MACTQGPKESQGESMHEEASHPMMIILMVDKALAMAVREGKTDDAVHHSANTGSISRG